jgi:predicted CxxxxCH...CXXCH cytochrome family protein
MNWGALSRVGGVIPNYSGSPTFSCATTYCHGAAFPADTRGSATVPAWTSTNGSFKDCAACHGSPPANAKHTSIWSRGAATPAQCNPCHSPTVTAGGAIDLAGGRHIDGVYDTLNVTCASCHGNPPTNASGLANAANTNGVGAHAQHAVAPLQTRTAAFACVACHPNNTSNIHADGTPTMTFAAGLGPTTSWNDTGSSCTTSYCHGDTTTTAPLYKSGVATGGSSVAQGSWGGLAKQPVWTTTNGTYRACTACHNAPPSLPHPTSTTCADCHPAGASQTAMTGAAATTHVDGHVDVSRTGCTACHGDYGSDLVASGDLKAAPGYYNGTAVTGRDVAGLTTGGTKIGGHRAHLQQTDLRNRTLRCDECHAIPADGNTAHANGVAAVDMAAATSTTAQVGGLSPSYATGNCSSVYCHGAGYTARGAAYQGSNTTLSWTDGTAARACGACHQVAPNNTVHTNANNTTTPQNCSACHGAGYNCLKTNLAACTVDPVLHINGVGNYPTGCTDCHGQPPATGAHVAHVNQTSLRSTPLDCDNCHGTKPVAGNVSHSDGIKAIGWSALATSNGTTASPTAANPPGFATPVSCSNYCHTPGTAAVFGGTNRNPAWAGGAAAAACGTCHGAPPPLSAVAGVNHPQNSNCVACHGAGYATTGITTPALSTHVNGTVEPRTGCTACHGNLAAGSGTLSGAAAGAPGYNGVGVDSHGNTAVTVRTVGAHDAHVRQTSFRAAPIPCAECHSGAVPADGDVNHANGAVAALVGGPLATDTSLNTTPSLTWNGTTCANTYCHGNFKNGNNVTVTWAQNITLDCNSCHGRGTGATPTPPSGTHQNRTDCVACHPDYTAVGADLSTHIDGSVTYQPGLTGCALCHGDPPTTLATAPFTGSMHPQNHNCAACHGAGYTEPAFTTEPTTHNKGSTTPGTDAPNNGCTACHGVLAGPTAAGVAPGATAAPGYYTGTAFGVDSAGSTATSYRSVGAHDSHVRKTNLRSAALPCSECHNPAPAAGTVAHANGTVDTGWGTLATSAGQITTASWNGATCSATYCHGNFTNGNANFTTPAAPSTPAGLVFSGVGPNTLILTWNAAAGAWYYLVERGTAAAGPFTQVGVASNSSFSDLQLTAATTYYYRVRAWNPGGTSAYSTVASQLTGTALATGARRLDLGGATATDVGTDGVTNITAQSTYPYGTAANTNMAMGVANYTLSATLGAFRNQVAYTANTTYNVVSMYSPPFSSTSNQVAANVVQNIDYRVRTAGSGASAQVRAILYEYNDATGIVGAAKATYTSAAISLAATGNRISLAANFTNAAFAVTPGNRLLVQYQIISSATAGGELVLLFGSTQSTTNGVIYITPTLSATTFTVPVAPTGLAVSAVESYQMTLGWNAVAGAMTYEVERSPNGTTGWAQVGQVTTTTFTDVGLTPGTTYWYRVRASNPAGDGAYSATVSQAAAPVPTGTVTWAGTYATGSTTLTCTSCHGNPPSGTHPRATNCHVCHITYGDKPASGAQAIDTAKHMNGVIDMEADCVGCHTEQMNSRRPIVGEFAMTWSHKKSGGGTVTKWDCVVCHMEGDPATGNRSGVHGDGQINLRDPDTGLNIKGVTFTAASGTNPGSYGPAAGDLAFPSFSRNLTARLEGTGADPNAGTVEAIMINQCLKCHDANGATAFNAGNPLNAMLTAGGVTRSAGKPFGTTIDPTNANYNGGSGYTACAAGTNGCVVNVNDSFATTNASYHPIRGKNSNWYARANRMNAPFNVARVSGTVPAYNAPEWGTLMTCWDCHASPSDSGTITKTVTAHGGSATLRGNVYTNPASLCTVCHIANVGAVTGGNHGTNSAFDNTSSTNNSMQTYINTQCHMCHASAVSRPARPIPAQDAHGVNSLPTAGTKSGRWSTAGTPIAFIRNTVTLQNHQPVRVQTSTYTATCSGQSPQYTSCGNGMGNYLPGGTF